MRKRNKSCFWTRAWPRLPARALLCLFLFSTAPGLPARHALAAAPEAGEAPVTPVATSTAANVSVDETKNLCGVYALYLALRFLGEEDAGFNRLLAVFPRASLEGTNLREIQAYLENRGYRCALDTLSSREFSKLSPGALAFVLKTEGRMAHLFLLRKTAGGKTQMFDFPMRGKILGDADLTDQRRTCLFVFKGGAQSLSWRFLPSWARLSIVWGLFGFAALFTILLSIRFFKGRKAVQ
jgi:hypothetical protein